jgi:hypothetical protein
MSFTDAPQVCNLRLKTARFCQKWLEEEVLWAKNRAKYGVSSYQ